MTSKFILALLSVVGAHCAELQLPPRPSDAATGSQIAARIAELPLAERERVLVEEIERGNVPPALRQFVPVRWRDGGVSLDIMVCPNYLMVGSTEDYFLTPLTPGTAVALAKKLQCTLPTTQLVDAIYQNATLKLEPAPLQPNPEMTKVSTFQKHQEMVREQIGAVPLSTLMAGHKKDVILMPWWNETPGKVAIYGWHNRGTPIQPLYLGHTDQWVDYSHGIRLIRAEATLDGKVVSLPTLLQTEPWRSRLEPHQPQPAQEAPGPYAIEEMIPGVRVGFEGEPGPPGTSLRLVIYGVPNGNTIAQTFGKRTQPTDDWHFNIQHIGAQARWLRKQSPGDPLVVAAVECAGNSWPAWRKRQDPEARKIPQLVERIKAKFPQRQIKLVLTGHSGGGAFVFGCLDGWKEIPAEVERIAFLDSNYAYDPVKHHDAKLAQWLQSDPARHLCIFAYEDSNALYLGKPIVSAKGGTWGKSLAMTADLQKYFPLTTTDSGAWRESIGLKDQVLIRMLHNPERAVHHTRLVELNGFIHALLSGTPQAGVGYEHWGPKVYEDLIR